MADMVTAEQLIEAKKKLPGCAVVCYVNTSAAVKAESDICCTSSNAPAVVSSLPPDQPILFVPDRNLGAWTAEKTGRKMTIWDGYCPTHERILPLFIERARTEHPHAVLVAHPECPASVRAVADHIASTAGILAFCRQANADEFIIATEEGILHRLAKENPGKKFYPASRNMNCPNMKRSTAERVLWCLEDLSGEITVDPETARRAKGCIDRMLALFPAATPKRQ
jgi:quinolinate synthase